MLVTAELGQFLVLLELPIFLSNLMLDCILGSWLRFRDHLQHFQFAGCILDCMVFDLQGILDSAENLESSADFDLYLYPHSCLDSKKLQVRKWERLRCIQVTNPRQDPCRLVTLQLDCHSQEMHDNGLEKRRNLQVSLERYHLD